MENYNRLVSNEIEERQKSKPSGYVDLSIYFEKLLIGEEFIIIRNSRIA